MNDDILEKNANILRKINDIKKIYENFKNHPQCEEFITRNFDEKENAFLTALLDNNFKDISEDFFEKSIHYIMYIEMLNIKEKTGSDSDIKIVKLTENEENNEEMHDGMEISYTDYSDMSYSGSEGEEDIDVFTEENAVDNDYTFLSYGNYLDLVIKKDIEERGEYTLTKESWESAFEDVFTHIATNIDNILEKTQGLSISGESADHSHCE